jgi:ferredoxin-type protein NapH
LFTGGVDLKTRQKIRTGILLGTFFLFPALFYYFSPYLVIESAGKGIVNGSLIVFLSMLMSSLVLGRAYCGWVCPAAGCQESIARVREKRIHKGDVVKWIIWIPWISALVMITLRYRGDRTVDFFYRTSFAISISDTLSFITYLLVLLLIVVPAFLIGRRSFCHHICWMAPFMILGRKIRNVFQWPSLRLAAQPDRCTHCRTCTTQCPMSLPVKEMVEADQMEHTECILCGTCIDCCKSNAITFRFRS